MSLPQGWAEAKFADILDYQGGSQPPKSEFSSEPKPGHIRLLQIRDFESDAKAIYIRDNGKWPRCCADDIMIGRYGASVGKILTGKSGAYNVALVKMIFDRSSIDPKYLCHWLHHETFQGKLISVSRSAQDGFNKEDLAEIPFWLPPLAEQRRIVAKLDALTARLARTRAELDRVSVLASAMRLSALRTSFHWDEDAASLPSGWARKRIDEVGSVQLGRQRSPKDHTGPDMRPYMRSANITWTGWDLSDVKEMNFSPAEFQTFGLQPGDVLLNEGSGSAKEVGKPATWNGEVEGACFQNTLLRIRPTGYLPELLRYCLLYVAQSGQFIRNTQGVNIIHIGKAGLARTIIPVPPQDQQAALLEVLNAAFARADRLEAEAARARVLLDRLASALLAKAFRGELVLQDPNDEPASVLLDRIRTQRAAASKAKRGRKAKVAA